MRIASLSAIGLILFVTEAVISQPRFPRFDTSTIPKEAIELNKQAGEMYRRGQLDSALATLDRAIRIDSSYSMAFWNKFVFLQDAGRHHEALRVAKQARQVKVIANWALGIEGLAFESVGQLDSAKACYSKTLELNPVIRVDTLHYLEQQGLATLLTIVRGKQYGLVVMQKLLDRYGSSLKDPYFRDIEGVKNEIECYQGGGYLEFRAGGGKEYFVVQAGKHRDFGDFLIDKGVNWDSLSEIGDTVVVTIRDKFRQRALGLALKPFVGDALPK